MARTETYDDTVPPRRGVSLAKGPVAVLGIASLALGILGFIFADQSFTFDAPCKSTNWIRRSRIPSLRNVSSRAATRASGPFMGSSPR